MSRVIMCGWCRHRVTIKTKDLPASCPNPLCLRVAKWVFDLQPHPPIKWDKNDRRFLKSLRIDPEDEPITGEPQ